MKLFSYCSHDPVLAICQQKFLSPHSPHTDISNVGEHLACGLLSYLSVKKISFSAELRMKKKFYNLGAMYMIPLSNEVTVKGYSSFMKNGSL